MKQLRPFGLNGLLVEPKIASSVWHHCNDLLTQELFSARGIMQQMNVRMVGTTDEPGSRRFLFYTRHEYFWLILCELLGSMVSDISARNAVNYFGFDNTEHLNRDLSSQSATAGGLN